MRSFRHWNPRYFKDRVISNFYRKRFPDRPWLTPAVIDFLDGYLKRTDIGLEFGSGNSTLWFADRIKHLTSIEHNETWYGKVQSDLIGSGNTNVDHLLVLKDRDGKESDPPFYVQKINHLDVISYDFVLVDGIYRDHCAMAVLDKILPGGILVIDNVNNYLPNKSFAPNSRTYEQGPRGEVWKQVYETISGWRNYWTSNGVWDTAVYFHP